MTDVINNVLEDLDREHADKPAATRRQIVAGAAAALGSMGILGTAEAIAQESGLPQSRLNKAPNTPENIVNIAATAEVLATIVNTEGALRLGDRLDPVTRRNIRAAARQELIHYETLTSLGARPATKRIWVPDEVFSSPQALLTTLAVGDDIFVNAYLLGITVFARSGGLRGSRFARIASEFMGVEAVHRALALQSLGRLGNDRAYMRFTQREDAPGLPTKPFVPVVGIDQAVTLLQSVGFGFGAQGSKAGAFYEFDQVSQRTPDDGDVNTRTPA
jgi:hypothetical protein